MWARAPEWNWTENSTMKRTAALLLFAFGLTAPAAAVAGPIYFSVEGENQGVFKGEVAGQKDKMAALSYHHKILSPRDATTGQASGKRQHGPVVVTKAVGPASPQMFQALTMSEVLTDVTFEVMGTNDLGVDQVEYRVRLTDAGVSRIAQRTERTSGGQLVLLEELAFTYQSIEVESLLAQTVASDDWAQ